MIQENHIPFYTYMVNLLQSGAPLLGLAKAILLYYNSLGKTRAKSFTAGDKSKLTPRPSHTPSSPAGTPKSKSPASSPKLPRRNATPKDVSKGLNGTRKTAEPRKTESHIRPHSDPLIAEK